MKKRRRTLLTLASILVVSTLLLISTHVIACEVSENESDCCTFCDGNELTIKEKCEELLVKALTDEKNLLDDGFISEEVYKLQCAPFEVALDELETATDEETKEIYKWILIYSFEYLAEYEAEGEEIDKDFYNYIEEECKKVGLAQELEL